MDYISRVGIFLSVVRHQSFAKAGRELGMTGPAISKQVLNLEAQLGVKLLHRTTRQVNLTEEGAIYYRRARQALEDLREAEEEIQELKACPTGILKVNAPRSYAAHLVGAVAAFAKQYPDVRVDIDFDDRNVDIIAEGYDVVIRIGALVDSSLVAKKLAPCPLYLVASPEYLARHVTLQRPEDLKKHLGILYTQHNQSTEWRYKDGNNNIGTIDLPSSFKTNSAEMIVEACLQGLGIALLPIFLAAKHMETGSLVHILPGYQTYPERGIYAVFPQNRYLSTKLRLFIDWLVESSKTLPW